MESWIDFESSPDLQSWIDVLGCCLGEHLEVEDMDIDKVGFGMEKLAYDVEIRDLGGQ